MYQIGDKVTHPMHGAGTIKTIIRQKSGGVVRHFFVLTLLCGGMELFVPCESCDKIGLRPIMSREAALELLRSLPQFCCTEDGNWNQRYRINMERLRSGDPRQTALIVKSLHGREQFRHLSNGERKMLMTARQVLLSELALSLECSIEEAERQLSKAI